ncbi:hypothetical protein NE237_008460 [Protea cynaroides]|uniref:Uncharacterized protein n=1 Tax=Protea cynaroides TaxID=273540 RepID=A0A9Q0QZC3_9MAGN|nr:hypothetical protein NE237_008460 [Protea cynaroides]
MVAREIVCHHRFPGQVEGPELFIIAQFGRTKQRLSLIEDCRFNILGFLHLGRGILRIKDFTISMPQLRNAIVATGLVAFAAAGLAFPFFFVKSKSKPIIDSSKPLPPQATFRGPYINTGSRDIGPDHGTYPKGGKQVQERRLHPIPCFTKQELTIRPNKQGIACGVLQNLIS